MAEAFFRAALGCALAGSAASAWAADSVNAPPAERFAISPGGVDMRSGRYVFNQTDLGIGGESGLSLSRTLAQPVAGHANPFANFSHNWDVLLSEKRVNIQQGNFQHGTGQDYQMEVTFGGLSQTFRGSGGYTYYDQISRAGFGQLTFTGDRASGAAVHVFTAGDGTQVTFRTIGSADCSTVLRCAYVAQIVQPDGTLLSFTYDDLGSPNTRRLRRVTSSRGYALLLEYGGAQVIKACLLNLAIAPAPGDNLCPQGTQPVASYSYTNVGGAPRLASATDPANATWGFTYPNATTMGFVRGGETAPWLTNSIFGHIDDEGLVTEIVGAQAFADGSSYSYSYEETPLVPLQASQIAGGSYTDNEGNVTTLRYGFPILPRPGQGGGFIPPDEQDPQPNVYQVTPGPVEIIDPLQRVTRIDYCDRQAMANLIGLNRCVVLPMPVGFTDPEGIETRLVTDMFARNVTRVTRIPKAGSGPTPDPIETSATYLCGPATARSCNKPLTTTDARGAVTEYSYAPEHGGLLTETGPAPAAGAPRPQTRHQYAQRTAWIANGSGGYIAQSPIWVLTATSLCRTSAATGNIAAPCASAGDEVRTTYDYGADVGPNTLLLRGQTVTATDGGVTTVLRTCYGYDTQGRRISETAPRAELTSCP